MAGLNRITIIGNVGKEVEMRFSPQGSPVSTFPVAVNNSYTSGGERKESTEWFNVVCWNKLAETVNQYVTKGMQVYVEGRLQTRSWEGKDGEKKYRTEVVANTVLFLGRKGASPSGDEGEDE